MCSNDNAVAKALEKAKYKVLDDGTYYGEIEDCPGVWANEKTLEECRQVLQEVLEEWLIGEEEITPEEQAAIEEGIADLKAGRRIKAEDAWKELGLDDD
jgi:predicted RNase H-like HicB family nuclease